MDKNKEIMERLKKEGKVTVLNSEEDLRLIDEMNKSTEKTKEEYLLKNFKSIEAAKLV